MLELPSTEWVFLEKNPHTPSGWGRLLTPLSPGFPETQYPPPVWISKTKDPPPAWISGKKILGLNLIYFK